MSEVINGIVADTTILEIFEWMEQQSMYDWRSIDHRPDLNSVSAIIMDGRAYKLYRLPIADGYGLIHTAIECPEKYKKVYETKWSYSIRFNNKNDALLFKLRWAV